ncbi:Protease inhibitor protein [Cucumis melo var. makuwa]|uniref:Protease inhibitor protein n=1 Tax=Cucumis melo var. makuwa TaxID=1194695 RepID=A0A5A7U4U0_CUCMM|nr:Protease inhibitor protein [Cucumis melo var. makuwa]TYK17272.1 Protease inhibitor protein [Cucumis melo var. makuwa]
MAEESAQRKTRWPELVFVEFSTAARIIEKENPDVKAIKILADSPRIENFDPSRVWVDCNVEDKVVKVPSVG